MPTAQTLTGNGALAVSEFKTKCRTSGSGSKPNLDRFHYQHARRVGRTEEVVDRAVMRHHPRERHVVTSPASGFEPLRLLRIDQSDDPVLACDALELVQNVRIRT